MCAQILAAYDAAAFNGSWFRAASAAITESRYHCGTVQLYDLQSALGSNVYGGVYSMPQTNGCPYQMLGLSSECTHAHSHGCTDAGLVHSKDRGCRCQGIRWSSASASGACAHSWTHTGSMCACQPAAFHAMGGACTLSLRLTQCACCRCCFCCVTGSLATSLGPLLGAIHGADLASVFELPINSSTTSAWNCGFTDQEVQMAGFLAGKDVGPGVGMSRRRCATARCLLISKLQRQAHNSCCGCVLWMECMTWPPPPMLAAAWLS